MKNQARRQKLIDVRKNKNWLQKDVVEKLAKDHHVNISESYYGMIEQGARTPSLNVALAISALFEVDPTDFFLTKHTTFCCEYKQKQVI